MKDVRLQQLILTNFKGFSFSFEPHGDNSDIHGDNATGKTTIDDAWTWLLFDKDSLGRSDFEIKNRNADGETEHGLSHEVEAYVTISDGTGNKQRNTLKKAFREIWTKPRGKAERVFSGHTTDYFIDGVPVQKNQYTQKVTEIAGDETAFRLLTSPAAFPALHWQKQRSLLLDACGNVSIEDVINSDEALSPLLDLLQKYTVSKTPIDDFRKVTIARRTQINQEMDKIPVRIDEVKKGMPDISGLDKKAIEANIIQLEKLISDKKLALQGVDNGGKIAELSKKLSGITADISAMEQAHYNATMQDVNKLSAQINEIKEKKDGEAKTVARLKQEKADLEKKIESTESKLEKLRTQWMDIDGETFTDTTQDVCPACGQSLPVERVECAREKARAAFNLSKAERLSEVEITGKDCKSLLATYREELQKITDSLSVRPDVDADESHLVTLRDEAKKLAEDYTAIPGRSELLSQKIATEAQIRDAKEAVSFDSDLINKEIAEISEKLKAAKADADKFTASEKGVARIDELMASEKLYASEFEKLERELYLAELFIKTKVSMHNELINSHFEIVKFKLFDELVNGGIEECCEITVNGIGYNSGLNGAAKINAGIDIIRTLQHHFGLSAPIFVDNAESVVNLLRPDCQIIRLIVSEPDKVLRVETEKRTAKAA